MMIPGGEEEEAGEEIAGPALRIAGKVYKGAATDMHADILSQIERDFLSRDLPKKKAIDAYYDALGKAGPEDEGFHTKSGRYVTRDEAYDIADQNGQLLPGRFERDRGREGELHAADLAMNVPQPKSLKKSTALVGPIKPQLPAKIEPLMRAEPYLPESFVLTWRGGGTGAPPLRTFTPEDIKLPEGAPRMLGGSSTLAPPAPSTVKGRPLSLKSAFPISENGIPTDHPARLDRYFEAGRHRVSHRRSPIRAMPSSRGSPEPVGSRRGETPL